VWIMEVMLPYLVVFITLVAFWIGLQRKLDV
jgi:hypothetical protein